MSTENESKYNAMFEDGAPVPTQQEAPKEEPVETSEVQEEVPSNTETETVEETKTVDSKEDTAVETEEKEQPKSDNDFTVNLYDEDEPSDKKEVVEESKEVDFDSVFQEKYADLGVESIDDLVSKYNELKEQSLPEGVDKIARLLSGEGEPDWAKIKEIAEVKTMDVDSMDERDILKKFYESNGYTPKEIAVELKDFDKIKSADKDSLYDDELDAQERKEAKLERTLREAKQHLNSLKEDEKYNIPSLNISGKEDKEAQAEAERLQAEQEQIRNNWIKAVDENIQGFEKITFNLDKEKSYDFEIQPEDRESIQNIMSNVSNLYGDYINGNEFNFKQMMQDLYIAKNWKQISKTLIAQSTNVGKENVVKELNNVDFSRSGSQKKGETKLSQTEKGILDNF